MHPIQFAVIGIVSLAFGLVTPPYALKDTTIILVPMLLVRLIFIPEIALFLPKLISPELVK